LKAVPRRAENLVAEQMNILFEKMGATAVERIPVLGREGPDISINQLKIIIDVKSRKSVPASMLAGPGEMIEAEGMVGFRISDAGNLETLRRRATKTSSTVRKWLDHMNEWTRAHEPEGIPAIVLRRPGMPRQASTVIIYSETEQQWNHRTKS